MAKGETHEEELKRLRELERNYAVMEEKVKTLTEKVDKINGHLSKMLWFVGGGMISSLVAWVMSGGLVK